MTPLVDKEPKKRNKCMIKTGAMSDPYIHLEEKLLQTRKCLEIISKYGFGVTFNAGYDTKGENIRGGIGLRAIF